MERIRSMAPILNYIALLLAASIVLPIEQGSAAPRERPEAIATINIIADLVSQVAGDRIEVHSLLPLGGDPHTYEPVPGDLKKIAHSDIVFYNGLGLEKWLEKLLRNAGGVRKEIEVTQGLKAKIDARGHTDPHLWMNPEFVRTAYIPNIVRALINFDPGGEEQYKRNAERYIKELEELDAWARNVVSQIPPENRKLVTTHDAFAYFGEHYGFKIIGSIWGVSTEDEPSPRDISRLIDMIKREKVKAVFVETTINPKLMESIAHEAKVKIGRPLYGDSLGPEGSGAETYIGMIKRNLEAIAEALR
ncbi:MAG: zinc ABC transporter substrate-binding protein [Candidatus Methanosuratincola sp.]